MKPTLNNDVPNNYFESLEGQLMERISKPVSDSFPYPKFNEPNPDYFDSLEEKLMARIQEQSILPSGLVGTWDAPREAYFESLEHQLIGKYGSRKSSFFTGFAAYGSVGIAIAMSLLLWITPKPQTSVEQQLQGITADQKAAYLELYFDGDVEQVAAHVTNPQEALIETTQKIDDQVIEELDLIDNL